MLTGKQKRFLRAMGHALKPVILIGKKEIDTALIKEAQEALEHHELIKVKLLESCMLGRDEASQMLADECSADVAQILGRTFLLYRAAKEPVITFSDAPKPAAKAAPSKKAASPATKKEKTAAPKRKTEPRKGGKTRAPKR